MNKKAIGISTPTLVILLISLAVIFSVYAILKPQFSKAGSSFNVELKCLDVETKPLSCKIQNSNLEIKIQLVKGKTEGLVAVFEFDDGAIKTKKILFPEIKYSETKEISIPIAEFGEIPASMKSTSIISTPNGENGICRTLSQEEIDCHG